MNSRYVTYSLAFLALLSLLLLLSLAWINRRGEETAVQATNDAVSQQLTVDAGVRMRQELAASVAGQALAVREDRPQIAMLLAVEARNIVLRGEFLSVTGQHAFRQVLAPETRLTLDGPGVGEMGAAISPDEQWLAAYGPGNSNVRLWPLDRLDGEAEDGFYSLTEHGGGINDVAFSPDGRFLVTGSRDDTAVIWNLTQADPSDNAIRLDGHTADVTFVAFSPGGDWLVTASDDHSLRLYPASAAGVRTDTVVVLQRRAATEDQPLREGHTDVITTLAFSDDGNWLASGGRDRAVMLWNLAGEPSQYPIRLATNWAVASVTFSDAGNWLLATGPGDEMHAWNLDPDRLAALACQRAGRNLTEAEWNQYLPERPYHQTCP